MTHDKGCRYLLDSLSDYIDGDLSEELCAELERHMVDCGHCRVVVDTLRKTVYLYKSTSANPVVPPDVRGRLYQVLERVMNFGLEVVHSRHGTKSISKRYNR